MKKIQLRKSVMELPESWEDLNFKEKLYAFEIASRVMSGDLNSSPYVGLLDLLIRFTGYKPSGNRFYPLCLKLTYSCKMTWVFIRNIPFLFKYGMKEFISYLRIWQDIYRPDPDALSKEREVINFNLLRLAEQIKFVFTIDPEQHKIIPQYNFKTNPIPFIKIGRKKYSGKRFELDITAKTDITAREFVDCLDLLFAIDKVITENEQQECMNQLCAILYPKEKDYVKNMVSGHHRQMKKVKPVIKFAISYWFMGILKFYSEHPVYSILFSQSSSGKDNTDKVSLSGEVILMLRKEGYGMADDMNLNDYFDAQIKHLKDSIGKALSSGLTATKISQETGLSISVINQLS